MLSWLLYAIVIGGLLTVGMHAAERVCQLTRRPTRWVWISALLLLAVLMGVTFSRSRWHANLSLSPLAAPTHADASSRKPGAFARAAHSFAIIRREVTRPIERTIALPEERLAVSLDRLLIITWTVLSTAVVLLFFSVYLHVRRARQQWPSHELHGMRVRLAPNSGPAVVGLMHPEIVIPQWLLASPVEEQRAVLAHEREHIRAGDPWLLAIACVITAVFVWHPAVWWMVSRLRLAMELDCDARVLRRGFAPHAYGSILIDLTERSSGVPNNALALADKPSHLKRRLLAMQTPRPRFALMQGGFCGVFTLLCLVTACVTKAPIGTKVEPVESVEPEEPKFGALSITMESENTTDIYSRAVTPEDSAHWFLDGGRGRATTVVVPIPSSIKWIWLFKGIQDSTYARRFPREAARDAAEPNNVRDSVLILVDGVRRGVFPLHESVPISRLHLQPKDISNFAVTKGGHWTVVLYGPDAANGVIDVETKEARARVDAEQLRQSDSLKQWSSLAVVDPQTLPTKKWVDFFSELEYNRLRDSVLVLVDGTRRGMFPTHERIAFDLLNLEPGDIRHFCKTTSDWAIDAYGSEAAHGVVDIVTKKAFEERKSSKQCL